MVVLRNPRLEAFKQAIEQSQVRRAQDLEERGQLLRSLSEQLDALSLSEAQRREVLRRYSAQQDEYLRERRKQVAISDFHFIRVIGAGAFGIVRLCRKKDTGELLALKQMRKTEMVRKNHTEHIRAEKKALSNARGDWVIRLHCTFQDDTFLYMVMDYLPGGDLMTHLQRMDMFTETEARFYTAELVEAVDYIHTELRCIHRDIKPDNILLDARGHIQLVDFGLCKHNTPIPAFSLDELEECSSPRLGGGRGGFHAHLPRAQLQSVFGTPDYVGPEAYRTDPCGKECDWWSVGIIMFEMLFGGPPFSDERHDPEVTAARVKDWRQHFHVPPDPEVGEEARDLLRGLICDPEDRLGAEDIRYHAFFGGLDFSRLREMEPPIKPVVRGRLDTSNFDDFSNLDKLFRVTGKQRQVVKDPNHFRFYDYDYRRDLADKKPCVATALARAMESPMKRQRRAPLLSSILSSLASICA